MWRRLDPVLIIALLLALTFSLYGIRWGRVECWNRDQMAMRGLHGLRPGGYLKPPFHTYLNHFLVLRPITRAEYLTKSLSGRTVNLNEVKLLGSRFLVVGLFLGTIALGYAIGLRAFGIFAARVIALLFATSAGFIAYDHFLSCDLPLLFFMMLALFFAQRITLRPNVSNYVLAGLFSGIATATKYNGLAIGIAIVIAHFLAANKTSWKDHIFSKRLFLGLLMVPIGFLAGNPYAVLDWKKFSADFVYNYYVTPRYEGQSSGHSYVTFLTCIPEIIGWPGAVLLGLAIAMSILFLLNRRDFRSPGAACFALCASVVLLYYTEIGGFPRMQTRFVLPVVPFLILMAGPFFQFVTIKRKWILYPLLLPVLLYNSLCCFFVGQRFATDPRSDAQGWIEQHAVRGTVMESSGGSPHWAKLPHLNAVELDAAKPNWNKTKGRGVIDLRMPHVNGRTQLFAQIFAATPWIRQMAEEREGNPGESLFTTEQLRQRNVHLITVYSSDYEVPSEAVRRYYADLLAGKSPYEIVFDAKTREPPRWVYPRDIDFLRGQITILQRRTGS